MATEFRGKGYAVEAARAAIDWSFATFELDRIIHCIDRDNTASQAVARRLGAHPEGETMLLGHAVELWVTRRETWSSRKLMSLFALDLALRAGTVALLLVLAASLFRDFGTSLAGRLAAAFALGSAAHAVTYSFGATTPVSVAHAPLIALSTGNVVVLWLFTRALFDDSFKLRWWHALVWAAVAAFSFVNCMWIAPASGARISIIAINLIALGFIVLAVVQTIASWSADLVERRRRVRVFIVGAAALYGGMNAMPQIAMSGNGAPDSPTR